MIHYYLVVYYLFVSYLVVFYYFQLLLFVFLVFVFRFCFFLKSFFWKKICKLSLNINLACSIIYLWLEGNIFSLVWYSYLSIFPDIFASSLLISCCSFSLLILSSILMVSFYILSKRLSVAKVALITKKEYGLVLHFLNRFITS